MLTVIKISRERVTRRVNLIGKNGKVKRARCSITSHAFIIMSCEKDFCVDVNKSFTSNNRQIILKISESCVRLLLMEEQNL